MLKMCPTLYSYILNANRANHVRKYMQGIGKVITTSITASLEH